MRGLWGGYRLQLRFYGSEPDLLIPIFTAPLFTLIFLAIVRHGGRSDLSSYAIVAGALIALWWFTLFHGGWVIQTDRWEGAIELLVSAPSRMALVVFGRILAVTTVGMLAFLEVWAVGRYVLQASVAVRHPGLLAATLAVTAVAMAATAVFMSALFVLARSAVTFSNSASYPFYVLGGILVPISYLPSWLQPLSKGVFLSWSAGLLRSSLSPQPVEDGPFRLAMVLVLAASALVLASWTMSVVLRRVRARGELGLA